MSFDLWKQKSEEHKQRVLYHANYYWITNFHIDGTIYFKEFEVYCDLLAPPYNDGDSLAWITEVVNAFSKSVDIKTAAAHSHLGTIQSHNLGHNLGDKLAFCTLKPIMSLLALVRDNLVDNIKRDFLSKAENPVGVLLAHIQEREQGEISQAQFLAFCDQYDSSMSLLVAELIDKIKRCGQRSDETSEDTTIRLANESFPSEVYENQNLWVTKPLMLIKELMMGDQYPHKTIEQLDDAYAYLQSQRSYKQIKNLSGLYHEKSVNVYNCPLFETCVMLNFEIDKDQPISIVKPGLFNGGINDLWAYSNHKDGFGRAVRIDNGKEGAPEALVSFDECISYLVSEPKKIFSSFLDIRQRYINKVDCMTITKERASELVANV